MLNRIEEMDFFTPHTVFILCVSKSGEIAAVCGVQVRRTGHVMYTVAPGVPPRMRPVTGAAPLPTLDAVNVGTCTSAC